MEPSSHSNDLGISLRIRRSKSRGIRNCVANTRVTQPELKELEDAAQADGKALSEWGRDVMLREARSGARESAVLTEIIALRMFTSTILRYIALGEKLSPEAFSQILSEIKETKHDTAKDVLSQYQDLQGSDNHGNSMGT